MARRTFFSFNYTKDIWRVNQIRSIPNITGCAAAGFQDASLWEKSKKQGVTVIKKMIDAGLSNTSVTVVFITYGAGERKYINYEIDQSLERGNGIVAVQIHNIKDHLGNIASAGGIPAKITNAGFKAYNYTNSTRLAAWIEEAATLAGK